MLISHSSDILANRLALAEARVSENRLALIARHRSDMALAAMHQTLSDPEDRSPAPEATDTTIDKHV